MRVQTANRVSNNIIINQDTLSFKFIDTHTIRQSGLWLSLVLPITCSTEEKIMNLIGCIRYIGDRLTERKPERDKHPKRKKSQNETPNKSSTERLGQRININA
jgi:hypothetical protein